MLRAGVIGVGYLGRFHAEKYKLIEGVELVAAADVDARRAELAARDLETPAYADYRDLLGMVDAVSVVVPTTMHFEAARFFLENGVHVLLEKPITRTLDEADRLIALAEERGLVLQIGHLERFNPAFVAASDELAPRPLFIEADRIGPFPERGTDVDVVLDLMIHDLDIILSLTGEEPAWVHAVGVPVITGSADVASVRLEFPSGCVANLTASRIAVNRQRKIKIFSADTYVVMDLGQRSVEVIPHPPAGAAECPVDRGRFLEVESYDALEREIRSFIGAVQGGGEPVVSGADGRRALDTALRIAADIRSRLDGGGTS